MADDDRAKAYRHFKKADPKLHAAALAHRKHLPSRLAEKRGRDALFDALASSIAGQQLSTKAASTIRDRLRTAAGGKITANSIAKLTLGQMRSAGLSGAKTKSLKELAKAVQNKTLDLPALRRIPEEEAAAKLTSIWGIGPWTAEMFLMFALGRPDVFSPGDLGLLRAIEEIYDLPLNKTSKVKLAEIAKKWSPYRTYASLILWRTRDSKP